MESTVTTSAAVCDKDFRREWAADAGPASDSEMVECDDELRTRFDDSGLVMFFGAPKPVRKDGGGGM